MKCYNCGTELIWGGDHDCEEHEEHLIVTNLSCPNCNAFILVYWGDKEDNQPTANNEYFQSNDPVFSSSSIIDFSESNPFSEVDRF